jgi:Fe-S-cluster containining protein
MKNSKKLLVVMEDLKFRCMCCGKCCHEVPKDEIQDEYANDENNNAYKRIPLFNEEADRLEKLAEEMDVPLRIIEDLVFPDIKNQKILVLTYRILLDNPDQCCPFYNNEIGCRINDQKPLACRAYPLALKTEDAFNMRINIDPLCQFTIDHREELEQIDFPKLVNVYDIEMELAKDLLNRSKQSILNLMEKQQLGEIEIPINVDVNDYNRYLNEWEREAIQ